MDSTNPARRLNVHKDGSSVRAQVNSVSFFTRASGLSDLAQVRYLKAARQGAGSRGNLHSLGRDHPIRLRGSREGSEVRRWNPLGFKIVDFRAEPEISSEAAK